MRSTKYCNYRWKSGACWSWSWSWVYLTNAFIMRIERQNRKEGKKEKRNKKINNVSTSVPSPNARPKKTRYQK